MSPGIGPEPLELIAAPWSIGGPFQRALCLLQLLGLAAAPWPALRQGLRESGVWRALALGTPLIWLLLRASIELLGWGHVSHGAPTAAVLSWALEMTVAIALTGCLQAALALVYVRNGRAVLPALGVVCALLALIVDVSVAAWLLGEIARGS